MCVCLYPVALYYVSNVSRLDQEQERRWYISLLVAVRTAAFLTVRGEERENFLSGRQQLGSKKTNPMLTDPFRSPKFLRSRAEGH